MGCFCAEGQIIVYFHHWPTPWLVPGQEAGMYGGNECVKVCFTRLLKGNLKTGRRDASSIFSPSLELLKNKGNY
jgi:hypothetical protein